MPLQPCKRCISCSELYSSYVLVNTLFYHKYLLIFSVDTKVRLDSELTVIRPQAHLVLISMNETILGLFTLQNLYFNFLMIFTVFNIEQSAFSKTIFFCRVFALFPK